MKFMDTVKDSLIADMPDELDMRLPEDGSRIGLGMAITAIAAVSVAAAIAWILPI